MAKRVQVTGDLFHGRVPAGAVYVGRGAPGLPASPYRNPYPVKQFGIDRSLLLYRRHLRIHTDLVDQARAELAGKDLACWCSPTMACHVDILLPVVAGEDPSLAITPDRSLKENGERA